MFASTREGLVWLGGLFDGEGCLSVRHNREKGWSASVIQFRMTDKDSLERAATVLSSFLGKDCRVLGPYKQRPRTDRGKCKDIYCLDVTNRNDVYAVIVAIWPFVNTRRQIRFGEFVDWYKTTSYHNKSRKDNKHERK